MKIGSFASRHMGPRLGDQKFMLETIGCESVNELVDKNGAFCYKIKKSSKFR